ncbi:hypothetical protein CTEN210_05210 [Chaetoceros tenuissimus]|uniref:Uncharacterized protein n=1 Tax=Chaetoceros tenuissimus TaxID=426638 RepID=A0AAD3CQ33_9STRA|nr:hypothetical protein CTEN210_05210 [Chaetoceros tenuissimus]
MSLIDTWISERFSLELDSSFWIMVFLVYLALYVIDSVAEALSKRDLSSNREYVIDSVAEALSKRDLSSTTKRSKYPTQAEWDAIVKEGPGVRMWKGKMTLFYNGEKLWDEENGYLVYSEEERLKWQVIMVLPGVEVIPENTFERCSNVETVIMADSVQKIEQRVFYCCYKLVYVRLSKSLENIGNCAFCCCESLTSIFIPPSCREIGGWMTFWGCKKLIILSVPQHTQLGNDAIAATALFEASPFPTIRYGSYENEEEVHQWIKNINQGDEFALHRECFAVNPPLENDLVAILKEQGLGTCSEPNSIDVTPLQYLEANPYVEVDEQEIVKKYILEMMGEVVF